MVITEDSTVGDVQAFITKHGATLTIPQHWRGAWLAGARRDGITYTVAGVTLATALNALGRRLARAGVTA